MNPASPDGEPCTLLPWDSEFFGFRIGRVNGTRLTRESTDAILRSRAEQQIRCLYFAADGDDAETLQLAFATRFQFVDLRVDMGIALESVAPRSDKRSTIRPARPEDLEGLQAIARKSHYNTRFFKDSGFPRQRAEDLYAEWIRRDMGLHYILVATADGNPHQPVGYITCEIDQAHRTGRIGLIAVDEAYQGKGLGRSLVLAALDWFKAARLSNVRVATQATNLTATRLYQAIGFRNMESSIWFHQWTPPTIYQQ